MHPDLYELDALGDMIRIDAIRELRRDLHMRPVRGRPPRLPHPERPLMNDEAADALLKDLEEPPDLRGDRPRRRHAGPDSRDDPLALPARPVHAPLRAGAAREVVDARAPSSSETRASRAWPGSPPGGSTGSLGCSTRAPPAGARCCSPRRARSTASEAFDPAEAAAALLGCVRERGAEARGARGGQGAGARAARRATPSSASAEPSTAPSARSCSRELEELASWYRDLVVVAVGAEAAAMHVDRIDELRLDATRERLVGAERAVEAVLETWRRLEEFNLTPQLALEALFIELARELRA